jgi:hypothetical protein
MRTLDTERDGSQTVDAEALARWEDDGGAVEREPQRARPHREPVATPPQREPVLTLDD